MTVNDKKMIAGAAIGLLLSSPVSAGILYTLEQNSNQWSVNPLEKAQTVGSFYGYSNPFGASANPDFQLVSNAAHFWLYENTTTNDISLGMIFDTPQDGSGAEVTVTTSGMPASANMAVMDDPSDNSGVINTTATFETWACCTDGAVVSGLNGTWDITIDIDLNNLYGINRLLFLNGPSASDPTYLALPLENGPIRLTASMEGVSVPEPSTLGLLGLGLLGLGWSRRRTSV